MKRIAQTCDWYEGRGARVRTARNDYVCDVAGCNTPISRGDQYAHLSHGLRIGLEHFEPADIVEVAP